MARPWLIHRPIVPCPTKLEPATSDDMQPLLEFLSSKAAVTKDEYYRSFKRGVMSCDGVVDLCKQNIGPSGVRMLREAIRDSSLITAVLLGADSLGPEGAATVADLIRDHGDTLQTVYMGCNGIGYEGAQAIATAAADSSSLRALWLKRNGAGPRGGAALGAMLSVNTRLLLVDLVNNQLGDEGGIAVCEGLASNANSAVRHVFLTGNFMTSAATPAIANLIRQDRLTKLFLGVNYFGDPGARILAGALSQCPRLRYLELASNTIGDDGAEALAEALPHNSGLIVLDLGFTKSTGAMGGSGNSIGDRGALALARGISQHPSLRYLVLSHNCIGAEGATALMEMAIAHSTICGVALNGNRAPATTTTTETKLSTSSSALSSDNSATTTTTTTTTRTTTTTTTTTITTTTTTVTTSSTTTTTTRDSNSIKLGHVFDLNGWYARLKAKRRALAKTLPPMTPEEEYFLEETTRIHSFYRTAKQQRQKESVELCVDECGSVFAPIGGQGPSKPRKSGSGRKSKPHVVGLDLKRNTEAVRAERLAAKKERNTVVSCSQTTTTTTTTTATDGSAIKSPFETSTLTRYVLDASNGYLD